MREFRMWHQAGGEPKLAMASPGLRFASSGLPVSLPIVACTGWSRAQRAIGLTR